MEEQGVFRCNVEEIAEQQLEIEPVEGDYPLLLWSCSGDLFRKDAHRPPAILTLSFFGTYLWPL